MARRGRSEPVAKPEGGWRGTMAALELVNFRWLFAGRFASNVARSMRVFLRGWMVLELTNSPFLMGLVVSSLSWPMLFLPFVGGVMADRVDRKRLLQWTESILTVLWICAAIPIFLAVYDVGPEWLHIQWWHFIISSFISGVVQSIGRPGHQAMIGSVVDERRLSSAVALDSLAETWPRVAGPSVAAVAIWLIGGDWQTWGPWLFGATSLAQLFTAFTIFMMKWEPRMDVSRDREKRGAWSDFKEGLALIRSSPVLLSLTGMGFAFMIFAGGASFLLPVFARDVLGLGSDGGAAAFGILSTTQGVGSSVGALINVILISYASRGRLMLVMGLLHAVAMIAFSQSTFLILSVVFLAVNAGTGVFFRNTQRIMLQRFAPHEARGRVMAMDVFQMGLSPVGVLIWGAVAEVLQGRYGIVEGTQLTWLIGGVMYAVVIVLFFAMVPALRSFDMSKAPAGRVVDRIEGQAEPAEEARAGVR